jgi:flavin-dependent dehydrogenase
MIHVETVVIGGGPAGAATGAGLAAIGREVMLLEKSSAPHHKVCGEFLSAETQRYLAALDIRPMELGAVPIEQIALSSGKSVAITDLPFRGLSLSRYHLDEALLRRAEGNGAMVKRATAARSVVSDESIWTVNAAEFSVRCRNLVIATGKVPLRGFEDDRDRSFVGLKIHLRVERQILESIRRKTLLLFFEQGYTGLQPVEGDTVNLCWLVSSRLVKSIGRSWDAWRGHFVQYAPLLGEIAAGGEPLRATPLAIVCPRGGYFHRGREPRAFYVGDRIAHIPPFTGDGLGIALATAALATAHIVANASAIEFERTAEALISSSIRNASFLATIGQTGMGRRVLTKAAACMPRLLSAAVRQTRIPDPRFEHGLRH